MKPELLALLFAQRDEVLYSPKKNPKGLPPLKVFVGIEMEGWMSMDLYPVSKDEAARIEAYFGKDENGNQLGEVSHDEFKDGSERFWISCDLCKKA